MRVSLVCRVCGRDFIAPRFDAKTCSSTCRQRLRRGGDLAYLAGLSKKQQRLERNVHDSYEALKVAHKEQVAATRDVRETKRKLRECKADQKRERFLDEITGRIYRHEQEAKRRQGGRATVAGYIKLFVHERRNDFSAEAIAAAINMPDHYPVELVAASLEDLKASGDYARGARHARAAGGYQSASVLHKHP